MKGNHKRGVHWNVFHTSTFGYDETIASDGKRKQSNDWAHDFFKDK